jgi:hypothetical protein
MLCRWHLFSLGKSVVESPRSRRRAVAHCGVATPEKAKRAVNSMEEGDGAGLNDERRRTPVMTSLRWMSDDCFSLSARYQRRLGRDKPATRSSFRNGPEKIQKREESSISLLSPPRHRLSAHFPDAKSLVRKKRKENEATKKKALLRCLRYENVNDSS